MVLGFGPAADKGEDVGVLIARKNYTKAIEVIRNQLKTQRNDPRLRMQLADVLVSAGKGKEAVTILLPLADEFAQEGFAAKAISVLKKVQKLEPGRRDIDQRLASLIQEKQRQATVSLPVSSGPALEIGIEEIGLEPPAPAAPVAERLPTPVASAPVTPRPEPAASFEPALDFGVTEGAGEDLALESAPLDLGVEEDATPRPGIALRPEREPEKEPEPAAEPLPEIRLEPEPAGAEPMVLELEPEVVAVAAATPAPVIDQDLLTGEFEDLSEVAEPEITLEPDPGEAVDPMTDAGFADELLSVIDEAFQAFPGPGGGAAGPDSRDAPDAGTQIVVSPLFKDFSVEELVAVIQGLNLLTFERGQVILREGEAGHSLYMLTSGTVKAFVKRAGKQVPIGELEEGAFFGEGSILTGKPRTATIVAKTGCELLELDRATLDAITQTHPHVWHVLQQFARQRAAART